MITLRMLGWSVKGLRCPDYGISFENGKGNFYQVNLIQMPNGTGKTTTLTLLRAALSGEATTWDSSKVRSFQKKKDPQSSGEFQVALLSNGKRVTITVLFDFDEGKVKYNTTVGNGKENGFFPPRECRDFLNPNFTNFFVFDGELAQQLLNPNETNAEKVIEYLYKLKYFKDIRHEVKKHWEVTLESTSASEEKGLTRRRNRVDKLSERIKLLKEQKEKIQGCYNQTSEELNKYQSKYQDKISEKDKYGNIYKTKEGKYNESIKVVENLAKQILIEMRSPHALAGHFGECILSLKNNLDRVKLPESTAKEFFKELEQEEFCVCGRPLDDEHRKKIGERASNYLGSEEMNLLNSIKSDIADQVGINPQESVLNLRDLLKKFNAAIDERDTAKTDKEEVETMLTEEDNELKEAKIKIDELEKMCMALKQQLELYENTDNSLPDEKTIGINVLERKLADATQKLAEITQTVEIKQKTDLLQNILARAQTISKDKIASKIREESNLRIQQLLPNNDIKIARVDKALYLEGQEAGSVGETLSVAYAFMATLFNNSERKLPFIVDSPANSIDLKVREEVACLIPKLTDQFIAFTISSERDGFVLPLEKACHDQIQYVTLFRKGDIALEEEAKNSSCVKYSNDGVYVSGKEFFYTFHQEMEE